MRIGIIGATGYTGQELIRIISNHPDVDLEYCTSTSSSGMLINEALPHLSDVNIKLRKYSSAEAVKCDLVFVALPHTESMKVVKELFGGTRIIDLSGDFRIKDKQIYEKWYGAKHQAPDLLAEAVYGLPELNKPLIKEAGLVANPGCYATASALALLPLAINNLLKEAIIDAKSGISGAGKEPSDKNLFGKMNENFMPYSVQEHKHQPEIDATLKSLDQNFGAVSFTPHLLPVDRGILCSIYVNTKSEVDQDTAYGLYERFYSSHPFINILNNGRLPEIKSVRGSNRCDISLVATNTGLLKIFSSIDNLIKGASGQAVQNMNIMFGLDETSGIQVKGLMP